MAIKFRCPGCRAKLYVPSRWQGNTIACPRCQAPAIVPPAEAERAPPTFDTRAVEASLAALGPDRHEDPFGDAPVTLRRRGGSGKPSAKRDADPGADRPAAEAIVVTPAPRAARPRRGLRTPLTVPWWVPYACLGLVTVAVVAAFFLGFWWASVGAVIR